MFPAPINNFLRHCFDRDQVCRIWKDRMARSLPHCFPKNDIGPIEYIIVEKNNLIIDGPNFEPKTPLKIKFPDDRKPLEP